MNNLNILLRKAAENGHLKVVKFLVKNGAIVDAIDINGYSALMIAAENGHLKVVKFLVEQGININGITALMIAAENGHLKVVKFLVEQGININGININGITALRQAAQNGHLKVVKFLVKNGAIVDAIDNNGWTALQIAAQNGHLKVAEFLKEHIKNTLKKDIKLLIIMKSQKIKNNEVHHLEGFEDTIYNILKFMDGFNSLKINFDIEMDKNDIVTWIAKNILELENEFKKIEKNYTNKIPHKSDIEYWSVNTKSKSNCEQINNSNSLLKNSSENKIFAKN